MEINRLFLDAGVSQEDIEVEIVNKYRQKYRQSTVLTDDPEMLNALEQTRSKIVKFLEVHAASHSTSIAYHMRHNPLRSQNVKKPTILIFFRSGSVLDFETLERDLREALRHELVFQLGLEFLSGQVDLAESDPRGIVPWPPFSSSLRNGGSLSSHNDDAGAATFGGWLSLVRPDASEAVKVGMTVSHLISPQTTSDTALHARAVDGTSSSHKMQIEFPASCDREYGMKVYVRWLQGELNSVHRSAIQAKMQCMTKYNADPVIGSVMYHSGIRKNDKNSRMDWALFETPSTFHTNYVPPTSWFTAGWPFRSSSARAFTCMSPICGFAKLKRGVG